MRDRARREEIASGGEGTGRGRENEREGGKEGGRTLALHFVTDTHQWARGSREGGREEKKGGGREPGKERDSQKKTVSKPSTHVWISRMNVPVSCIVTYRYWSLSCATEGTGSRLLEPPAFHIVTDRY